MCVSVCSDNITNQKVLRRMLQRLGFDDQQVTMVENGALALQAVEQAWSQSYRFAGGKHRIHLDPYAVSSKIGWANVPFHLIFMDCHMPMMGKQRMGIHAHGEEGRDFVTHVTNVTIEYAHTLALRTHLSNVFFFFLIFSLSLSLFLLFSASCSVSLSFSPTSQMVWKLVV